MRARGEKSIALLVALATAGCATVWKPGYSDELFAECPTQPDSAFTGKIPPPVTVDAWSPADRLKPGFLHIHYRTNGTQTWAIGVHFVDPAHVSVPFIVGPLKDVPQTWVEDPNAPEAAGVPSEWFTFFGKLRQIHYVKPGGLLCRNRDCALPPDVPPPDLVGTASSASSGDISGFLSGDTLQRYAQASTAAQPDAGRTATDGAYTGQVSAERKRIISDVVDRTCRGVRAITGK
jgi:hypothetical protein